MENTRQPRSERFDALIVGAGVCGLSLARLLTEAGQSVCVLERDESVGGLARTFDYDQSRFDIGPHRFHTADEGVRQFILDTLGDDALSIPRLSLVHFRDHYYHWPIHPSIQLLRFPWRITAGIAFDLLFRLYRRKPPVTFAEYIQNMYGRTLYDVFFRDYSSKFLGIPPEETDADWAKTGIDRAIIDERLQINTLWELVRSIIVGSGRVETQFIYPKGGIGVFSQKLKASIESGGGQILCGYPVSKMEIEGDTIKALHAGDRRFAASRVYWTAPITHLSDLCGVGQKPSASLRYLDIVFYNVMAKKRVGPDFQWCYFGEKEIPFTRVSRPEAFDPGMSAEGKSGLCVEVSAPKGQAIWDNPEAGQAKIIEHLVKTGLLGKTSDVVECRIERVPECYPIYSKGYRNELAALKKALSQFENLTLSGRTGLFWYNNMDHSIAAALKLGNSLSKSG
jgi:protoporphyrinogen oxidase